MLPELHVDAQLGPPGRLFSRFQRMSGRKRAQSQIDEIDPTETLAAKFTAMHDAVFPTTVW
jgi:hypothetical protein